jgi:transcriptional regulator with XRE-family HTH domain
MQSAEGGDLNDVFRANVRATREHRGLSQVSLAQRLADYGYTWPQSTVQRIETGQRRVDVAEAHALASALGVSITTLLSSARPEDEARATEIRRALENVDETAAELHRAQERHTRALQRLSDLNPAGLTGDDQLKAAALSALEPTTDP